MNDILADVFFFYRQHTYRLLAYIVPVSLIIALISLVVAQLYANGDAQQFEKIFVVTQFILGPIYLGGFNFLIAGVLYKRSVNLKQCLYFGIFRWMPLLAVTVVAAMATSVGILLFIIPGLWIFSRLILAPFYVTLDQKNALDALTESFHRTADEVWQIMGVTFLVFMLIELFKLTVLNLIPDSIIGLLVKSVLREILWSFLTLVWFRFYDLINNGN